MASDRDIVSPANGLLYTTAWINLDDGPRLLHVPSARQHGGRQMHPMMWRCQRAHG